VTVITALVVGALMALPLAALWIVLERASRVDE
jgi:hypothetical protein